MGLDPLPHLYSHWMPNLNYRLMQQKVSFDLSIITSIEGEYLMLFFTKEFSLRFFALHFTVYFPSHLKMTTLSLASHNSDFTIISYLVFNFFYLISILPKGKTTLILYDQCFSNYNKWFNSHARKNKFKRRQTLRKY